MSDEILTTNEQRRRLGAQKTQRFWDVYWPPRRQFDRYLIIGGGAKAAAAVINSDHRVLIAAHARANQGKSSAPKQEKVAAPACGHLPGRDYGPSY